MLLKKILHTFIHSFNFKLGLGKSQSPGKDRMNQKNLKFDIPSVGTDEERKGQSRTSSTRTLYNPFKVDIKKKKIR